MYPTVQEIISHIDNPGQLFWALLLTGGCMVIEAAGDHGYMRRLDRKLTVLSPPGIHGS